MTALIPRVFDDVGAWLTADFPFVGKARFIRVEDYQENGTHVIRAELPGIDPQKDISINVFNGVLDIRAERREQAREGQRSEFLYGSLHRSMHLPTGADAEHIAARYDDGILEVSVPVNSKTEGRSIPIAIKEER